MEHIIGTEILEGDIRLGHTFYEVNCLTTFIKSFEPDWFIELGIHNGGLTISILESGVIPASNYYGVEIDCGIIHPKAKALIGNNLICGDCFSDSVKQRLLQIMSFGSGILYCDGGHKAKELKFFYEHIPSGSIIMAHDYGEGQEVVGVPGTYGKHSDFPRPEVLPEDVEFFVDVGFTRLDFYGTRIIAFMKN